MTRETQPSPEEPAEKQSLGRWAGQPPDEAVPVRPQRSQSPSLFFFREHILGWFVVQNAATVTQIGPPASHLEAVGAFSLWDLTGWEMECQGAMVPPVLPGAPDPTS